MPFPYVCRTLVSADANAEPRAYLGRQVEGVHALEVRDTDVGVLRHQRLDNGRVPSLGGEVEGLATLSHTDATSVDRALHQSIP
jgi:hypothetical protein